jgi:hypothetical protein
VLDGIPIENPNNHPGAEGAPPQRRNFGDMREVRIARAAFADP